MSKDPFLDILHYSNDEGSPKYHIQPSTVDAFFNVGDRKIVIPKYQRPYSWSKDNVLALLKDINDLDTLGQWFLGPIFVVKKTGDKSDITLLDGQQRVTTYVLLFLELYKRISILLATYNEAISNEQDQDRISQIDKLEAYRECLSKNLVITIQGERKSRFEAEENLKSIFSNFIVDWTKPRNDEAKFKTLFEEFNKNCLSKKGVPASKALLDNFKIIQSEIDKNLNKDYDDIEKINNIIFKILYSFWLIEIPLQKASASIRIFESLNNRGRPLTLVDKFRYRTLIDKTVYGNADRTTEVSKKWKEIFTLFEEAKESKEDFFQYFFMSKLGIELSLTNHADFFEHYEELYANNPSNLDQFLDEIIYFLQFLKCCKNNDTWKTFIQINLSELDELKKAKITGIFDLCNHAMKYSKASRFLFFKSLRDNLDAGYNLIIELFKINQHVFWTVFNDGVKSNQLRNDYLSLCKNSDKLSKLLNPPLSPPNFQIARDLESKIILNDQAVCHFLLIFYTYLTEPLYLKNWNSDQVDNAHVEHLMPTAWKNNWPKSKDYTITQAIEWLKENKDKYEFLDIAGLINYFERDETEFSPREYETAPFRNTKTIIEFIGNRWVLSPSKNIKLGNKSLADKKKLIKEYLNDLTYPSPDSEIGLNKYNSWDSEKILERSLVIINTLYAKLSKTKSWDQFD